MGRKVSGIIKSAVARRARLEECKYVIVKSAQATGKPSFSDRASELAGKAVDGTQKAVDYVVDKAGKHSGVAGGLLGAGAGVLAGYMLSPRKKALRSIILGLVGGAALGAGTGHYIPGLTRLFVEKDDDTAQSAEGESRQAT